jgi:hypothetical protein
LIKTVRITVVMAVSAIKVAVSRRSVPVLGAMIYSTLTPQPTVNVGFDQDVGGICGVAQLMSPDFD